MGSSPISRTKSSVISGALKLNAGVAELADA